METIRERIAEGLAEALGRPPTDEELDQALRNLGVPEGAPAEDLARYMLESPEAFADLADTVAPESVPVREEAAEQEEQAADRDLMARFREAQRRVAEGTATAEDHAVIEQAEAQFGADIIESEVAALAQRLQAQDGRLNQVAAIMNAAGLVGVPIEDMDWGALWQIIWDMDPGSHYFLDSGNPLFGGIRRSEAVGYPGAFEDVDEGTMNQWYQERVSSYILANPDHSAFFVQIYAQDPDLPGEYAPETRVDGFLRQDLESLERNFGLGPQQALLVSKVAKQHNLDPNLLAQAWNSRPSDLTDRLSGGVEHAARSGRARSSVSDAAALSFVAGRLATNLDQFGGSPIVALVAVHSPEVANKLLTEWWALTPEEQDIVAQAAGSLDTLSSLDGVTGEEVNFVATVKSGGGRVVVDNTAVTEAARTLANAWNLPVDDHSINKMVSRFNAQATAELRSQNPFVRQSGIQVVDSPSNTSSFLREQLRKTPEYQRLFAHLAPGESEEAYVSRFQSASASAIGDVDPGLVSLGQESGDVNTVSQAALLSGKGYDSSRFRQRLATAAEAFRSRT